ncbi:MAG TPA: hypothetical protein VFB45_18520 [Pseudolabrys sp.]|nr:hypothetical protein [Pseudolabrys sp.]
MKRLFRIAVATAVIATPTAGAALAQGGPALTIPTNETRRLSPEEIEKRKQVDDAYQEAIKKTPAAQKSTDPWGNVRPSTDTKKTTGR